MYKRILVPLDGSNEAEAALDYAEEISSRLGAEMVLVSVSGPSGARRDHLFRYYLESVAKKTRWELEDWGAREGSSLKIDVLFGKPADEIIRYSDQAHVGLIVMASRGRSGLGPWFLGNIAAKVLRATEKPVLLIRVPADDSARLKKRLIRKILVPLDGSSLGERAIVHAEVLARKLRAVIVLLLVLEPPRPLAGESANSAKKLRLRLKEENERRKIHAAEYLEDIAKTLQEKGLAASTAVLSGSAADEIIDYAKENGVDLIAMSSHGRSGMGRWVFGSVTDKVVHAGDTPLLVVRAEKAAS